MYNSVIELEKLEKRICNIPVIFAEMFKDEVNANEEQKLFNGVKRIIKKYNGDKKAISIINEFTAVICGGASLDEILQISRDEAINPSAATDITVTNDCNIH